MTTLAQIWTERARKEGIEIGIEKGIERGRQEGIERGRQEGMRQGIIFGIETVLEVKFGVEAKPLLSQIRNIRDIDVLQNIQSFLKAAKTVDEVKSFITPYARTS